MMNVTYDYVCVTHSIHEILSLVLNVITENRFFVPTKFAAFTKWRAYRRRSNLPYAPVNKPLTAVFHVKPNQNRPTTANVKP